MNDNANIAKVDPTVYEQRDHWKTQAQTAWQDIAELRRLLVMAMTGPLGAENVEWARVVLERTKP